MLGYVLLTFRVRAEDGQFAAYCDELGVASCGDTVQDAFRAIEEATLLYLNVLNVIEDGGERENRLSP
ncbi:MAG TPA: type II toxin-antitoxin system HicB family antitoxin [Dehalococcoidia bacterium]|nr:type II toxin-antitoxin system HicB family antitoxin [Dehalococcoidia bacterium]